MINDKAKVILIGFSITTLLGGCSMFRHLDGSDSADMQKFRTGTPTYYEDKQEAMMGRLMKEREQELLADKISWKPMAYDNSIALVGNSVSVDDEGIPTDAAYSANVAALAKEDERQALELTQPLVVASLVDMGTIKAKAVESTPAREAMMRLMENGISENDSMTEAAPITETASAPTIEAVPVPVAISESVAKDESIVIERAKIEPVSISIESAVPSASGAPKIKVVSGDGMPLSAIALSKKLNNAGYNVDRIDIAPFTFEKPVVFYAPGFKGNAEELADNINAEGSIKPLTWNSVYDIIVVSVN